MKKLLLIILLLPCLLFAQDQAKQNNNKWQVFGSVAPNYYYNLKNKSSETTLKLLLGIKNTNLSVDVYSEPSINLANSNFKYYNFGVESDYYLNSPYNIHFNAYIEPSDIKNNGGSALAYGVDYDMTIAFLNLGCEFDKGANDNLYIGKIGSSWGKFNGFVGLGESNFNSANQVIARQQIIYKLSNSINVLFKNDYYLKSHEDQVKSSVTFSF